MSAQQGDNGICGTVSGKRYPGYHIVPGYIGECLQRKLGRFRDRTAMHRLRGNYPVVAIVHAVHIGNVVKLVHDGLVKTPVRHQAGFIPCHQTRMIAGQLCRITGNIPYTHFIDMPFEIISCGVPADINSRISFAPRQVHAGNDRNQRVVEHKPD